MSDGPEELGSTTQHRQSSGSAAQDPVDIRELVELPPRAMRGSFCNRTRELIVRAAYHQLAVRRMNPTRLAGHDPRCSLCEVRVPWKRGAVGDSAQLEPGGLSEAPPSAAA